MDEALEPLFEIEKKEPILRSLFAKDRMGNGKKMVMKAEGYIVLYHDITDLPQKNRINVIEQAVTMERQCSYQPQKRFMIRMQVFKVDEGSYTCLLSYASCTNRFVDIDGLLEQIIGKRVHRQMEDDQHNAGIKAKALDYYGKALASLPSDERIIHTKDSTRFYEEVFPIDEAIVDKLRKANNLGAGNIKVLSFCIWAMIFKKAGG